MIAAAMTADDPRAAHHQAAVRKRVANKRRPRKPAEIDAEIKAALPLTDDADARDARVDIVKVSESCRVLAVTPAAPLEDTIATVTAAVAQAGHAIICALCVRQLCRPPRGGGITKISEAGPPILSAEDWCRWCTRPISERGESLTPRDGFVAFVRRIANWRS